MAILLLLGFIVIVKSSTNKELGSKTNDKIKLEAVVIKEDNAIELNIYNNDKETITCDLQYEIQVNEGNAWKKYADEINIDALGIEILANESYIQNIILDNKNIEKDKVYRIKKVIGGVEYYSNEFDIE